MFYILQSDIEGHDRHYKSGDLLNSGEMFDLIRESGYVQATCFITEEEALEYNRTEGYTI